MIKYKIKKINGFKWAWEACGITGTVRESKSNPNLYSARCTGDRATHYGERIADAIEKATKYTLKKKES